MDPIEVTPEATRGRHLLSPRKVARASETSADADLTRHHGEGNGLRVNGVYFAVISVVALVLLLILIAVASSMM